MFVKREKAEDHVEFEHGLTDTKALASMVLPTDLRAAECKICEAEILFRRVSMLERHMVTFSKSAIAQKGSPSSNLGSTPFETWGFDRHNCSWSRDHVL